MRSSVRTLPMNRWGFITSSSAPTAKAARFSGFAKPSSTPCKRERRKLNMGSSGRQSSDSECIAEAIADNGGGMSAHDLVEFFNTFGGGGKSIGGPHENFGVGAKTSLFPWNPNGVVVISWQDGEPTMIWVQRNPDTGEYGLRVFEAQDPGTGEVTFEHVATPFPDAEHGCDWSLVGPHWVREHGTVLILLGSGLGSGYGARRPWPP